VTREELEIRLRTMAVLANIEPDVVIAVAKGEHLWAATALGTLESICQISSDVRCRLAWHALEAAHRAYWDVFRHPEDDVPDLEGALRASLHGLPRRRT